MSIEKPIWWTFAVFDKNGLTGIKDDAPDDMKKAFTEYLRQEEEARKGGVKL